MAGPETLSLPPAVLLALLAACSSSSSVALDAQNLPTVGLEQAVGVETP